MDIDSLAQALFGGRRAEEQEVETNATTRTYMGVAVSDSSDGTVRVDLGGDVTLPDDLYDEDGNVVAEWDGAGIEMSTSPQVREGQDVIVTLVGGTSTKRPMVTAVAGRATLRQRPSMRRRGPQRWRGTGPTTPMSPPLRLRRTRRPLRCRRRTLHPAHRTPHRPHPRRARAHSRR